MVRKLLRRKAWIICFVAMVITGLVYLANVHNQRAQVEAEWRYWTSVYQEEKQRYESLVQSNTAQEGKNRELEVQTRGIYQAVSNWENVTYEHAMEVGAGAEYVKYILAEKLDGLANKLASTSNNKMLIKECQNFITDIKDSIGEECFGHNAIEYAGYLIKVFKDRK